MKLAEKRAAEAQAAAAAAGEAAQSDRQGSSKGKQQRAPQQAEQQVRQAVYACIHGVPRFAFGSGGGLFCLYSSVLMRVACWALFGLNFLGCCVALCCVVLWGRCLCGSLTRAGWRRLRKPRHAAMRPSSRQSTGEGIHPACIRGGPCAREGVWGSCSHRCAGRQGPSTAVLPSQHVNVCVHVNTPTHTQGCHQGVLRGSQA